MRMPLWLRLARVAAACTALFLAALAAVGQWRLVPEGDNPFVELALHHPLGDRTPEKIDALRAAPGLCRATLQGSTLEYRSIKDKFEGEFCGFSNAVTIKNSNVKYSSPVSVTCPMAAALYIWEREVVQPLAEKHFGQSVRRVEHVGTYACRRVYGGRRGLPSEHATANAIDVIGFTLDDGAVVSVFKHWEEDDARAAFLHELHGASCGVFRGVLGPEYNKFHRDHFHLDLGDFELCR